MTTNSKTCNICNHIIWLKIFTILPVLSLEITKEDMIYIYYVKCKHTQSAIYTNNLKWDAIVAATEEKHNLLYYVYTLMGRDLFTLLINYKIR